jgi:hypothetical protein
MKSSDEADVDEMIADLSAMNLSDEAFLDAIIADLLREVELAKENVNNAMNIVKDCTKLNKRFAATVTYMEPWLTWTSNVSAQVDVIVESGHSLDRWNQLMDDVEEMAIVAKQVTEAIQWKKIPGMDLPVTRAYISTFKILDGVLKAWN